MLKFRAYSEGCRNCGLFFGVQKHEGLSRTVATLLTTQNQIEGVYSGLSIVSLNKVDRKWLWVYYTKIPRYPIFYLLKGDYKP